LEILGPGVDASRTSEDRTIATRVSSEWLTAAEAAQYVKFRLMTAGRMNELFTEAANKALHDHSGGICRSLNKLAMLSLIDGADRNIALIDETIVNGAARRM